MAFSAIENKYLSALTAVQFPTEPVEQEMAAAPEKPMAPGQRPGDILVAEVGSRGLPQQAYSGKYPDTIKAIEQSTFEKAMQNAGIGLEQAGRFLDSLGQVDVPVLGKISLADFVPFVGTVKDGTRSVLGEAQWQGTPMALQQAGTGQSLTRGTGFARRMTDDASLAAMDVALNTVPVAKAVMATGKALAPKAAEMTINALEKTGMPARGLGIVESGPNVVSTRLPTAVKATEDPLANNLVIDLQAAKTDPEAFNHNVGLVKQYPNFASKARNPEKQAEDFINEVKDNLLFLHDQVPDATRQRSKLWYDGARNITSKWSNEYQVPDQAVSGVLAVLSPQKDWFMNVSLGQRVLDIMSGKQAYKWDDGMTEMGKIIWSKPQYAPMVEAIKGKTLAEITDPGLKAMWLRTYDQAYLPREHQIVTPEGDFAGLRMNSDGKTPTKTGWGSLNEIGKAIVILGDPSKANISNNLGDMHKVRNFYNNIYAPNDPSGAVTIDTHAVAAGLLRPLSGNSREVMHNFGSGLLGEGGPKNSSITGVKGTYGLYAEAYRRAAQDRGILPREMQSITWEAVRGLFPDTFKTATNADKIDNIWLQYRKGKLSLDEARNEVFNAAGGINAPEWERAGLRPGAAPEVQPSINQGQLPGTGIPGGTAGGMGSGERSGAATGDSSSVKRGRQARNSGAN